MKGYLSSSNRAVGVQQTEKVVNCCPPANVDRMKDLYRRK